VRSPAGLDLGPISHEEIAVAVLAEVVKLKAEGLFEPAEPAADIVVEARDPVCGMTVRTDSRHRAVYEGRTFYFCCGGCRERFVAAPASFL
jgi:xanthine dehydrogenase accessory factor